MNENLETVKKRIDRRGKLGGKLEEEMAIEMFPTERWPTPTARDYKDSGNIHLWKESRERKNLPREVYKRNMDQRWPTPTANEDAAGRPNGKMQRMLGNHPDVRSPGGGTLNPTWVEWLMGYPKGWTDLNH